MTPGVEQGIESLRRAFPDAKLIIEEDGAGGAHVVVETVELGGKYAPEATWMGGHLPPQLPYADVYPLFIDAGVRMANGSMPPPPITPGHNYRGRPALQVSRRTNRLDPNFQTAAGKFLKVIHWMKCEI